MKCHNLLGTLNHVHIYFALCMSQDTFLFFLIRSTSVDNISYFFAPSFFPSNCNRVLIEIVNSSSTWNNVMWQHIQYGNGKNKNIITRDSHIQHMISNLMGRAKIVDEFCLLSRIVIQCFMAIRIFTLIVMERKKWELHSKTPSIYQQVYWSPLTWLWVSLRQSRNAQIHPNSLFERLPVINSSFWSQHETIFRQNSASVSIAFNISKKMIELLLSSEKKKPKAKKQRIFNVFQITELVLWSMNVLVRFV